MTFSKEEDKLIQDCLRGKKKGQKKLYEKYVAPMMGVCLRYLKNTTDAEDALQDGFVTVFMKINQYKKQGSLGGWIYRIMVNTALAHLKKKNKVVFQEKFNNIDNENQIVSENKTDHIEFSQEILMEFVRALPDKYRVVFNMYVIDGFKHKEIAESLGINENTSKSNLLRARKILKHKIGIYLNEQEQVR